MKYLKWKNLLGILLLHYHTLFAKYSPLINGWNLIYSVVLFQIFLAILLGVSTTVCAHRYYTHRSFKFKNALKYFFLTLQTATAQDPIISWVRDHRCHHKFVDTNADPYNSKRGLLFSHITWLFVKKHPDVYEAGRKIDLSDVANEKVLILQKRYYATLASLLNLLLVWITSVLFNLTFAEAVYYNVGRYVIAIHLNFCINSFAHFYGQKPFDKTLSATDSKLFGTLILGEGWHNFHHVWPNDYRTSETKGYLMNLSTAVIDFFAKLGWIYDLKETPRKVIEERASKTGDGSFKVNSFYSEKLECKN